MAFKIFVYCCSYKQGEVGEGLCVPAELYCFVPMWSLNVLLWAFGGKCKHWGIGKQGELVERTELETLVL